MTALPILAVDDRESGRAVIGWEGAGMMVRRLRGRKMRTVAGLFDESAAALQFPSYFGENWGAFDECLSEMEWVSVPTGVVLLMDDPLAVLADEPEVELGVLVQVLGAAARTYAEPIALGEFWDRPAVPFRTVLRPRPADAEATVRRWTGAGVRVVPHG